MSTKKPGRTTRRPQVTGFAPGMGLTGVAEMTAPKPRPVPAPAAKRKAKR